MLVSVITPSYNQGQYLEETILSVLNQDYPAIEYIIIDGGSSDNSKDIIVKYAEKISYWISEPDKGQADALNKGFGKANGDLICWINSDDILYPDFVSERVKQFNENPEVDFIYGDVEQGIDLNHKFPRKGSKTDYKTMLLSLRIPIPQQSAIWRRTIFEKVGYLDTQWHVILDWEYFMRIAKNCRILYKPGALAFFRNHDTSKSVMETKKWALELEKYYKTLFSIHLSDDYMLLKSKALSSMYFECALIYGALLDFNKMSDYFSLSKREDYFSYKKKFVQKFLRELRHQISQTLKRVWVMINKFS